MTILRSLKDHTDVYFLRASEVVKSTGRNPIVTMQFFAKKNGMVAGLHECFRVLCDHYPGEFKGLDIRAVEEGSKVSPFTPIMTITAPYIHIGPFETVLLGILARRSLVATNTMFVVKAANGKPVIFMGARHEDPVNQRGDGYAVRLGGIEKVSTHIASHDGKSGVGTMPHSLIAAMDGDVVAATIAFAKRYPDVPVISLVDYNNDCPRDAVAVAMAMRLERLPLYGVRLDTSEALIDESVKTVFWQDRSIARSHQHFTKGVSPQLVRLTRHTLDVAGFPEVKIIASGGFTPHKIRQFESEGVPIDGYGVGSSILGHCSDDSGLYAGMDFTADVVFVDAVEEHKVGREPIKNSELKLVGLVPARAHK